MDVLLLVPRFAMNGLYCVARQWIKIGLHIQECRTQILFVYRLWWHEVSHEVDVIISSSLILV